MCLNGNHLNRSRMPERPSGAFCPERIVAGIRNLTPGEVKI